MCCVHCRLQYNRWQLVLFLFRITFRFILYPFSLLVISRKESTFVLVQPNLDMLRSLYAVLLSLLRGAGQVIFQENPLTGLLILLGLGYYYPNILLMGFIALLVSTLTAHLIGCSREEISKGLWGFNGFLVGLGVGTFFLPSPTTYTVLGIGSILSVVLPYLIKKRFSFPLYTAPFVLIVWGMLLLPTGFLPLTSTPLSFTEPLMEWRGILFRSFSQIFLQGGAIQCGVLILGGLLIASTSSALWGLLGALLPLAFFWIFQGDFALLNAGMIGYNGILVAIALGQRDMKEAPWVILGVLLAFGLQLLGIYFHLTTLTAPFVIATWITPLLKRAYRRLAAPQQNE